MGLRGYPAPFFDDAYFIGAAINLTQHGVFSNPLCESLATIGCANQFFAYMPLHSYVLAGWIKLFGLSTISFHVLYTGLALAVSFLIYRLFPVTNYSWGVALFICVAVFGLLGGAGLRADALGLFFFFWGFDCWREKTVMGFFWKNLLLGLAVITFPNVAISAISLSLAALLHQRFIQRLAWSQMVPFALAMSAAYVICFLLLLFCIDGKLFEFLTALSQAQHWSALGVQMRFQLFSALGIAKWVVPQLAFFLLVVFLIYREKQGISSPERLFFLILSLFIFAILGYASFNSSSGAHVWAFGCLIAALFILAHEDGDLRAWSLYFI